MNTGPAGGDLALYLQRGAELEVPCEVLGHTAKRVRILLRLPSSVLSVRYVKTDRLRRIAGGVLADAGGGRLQATERKAA